MLQPQTTTTEEIQENYALLSNLVKKTGQPVIILRNNKPDTVLISFKKLEEFEAIVQNRKETTPDAFEVLVQDKIFLKKAAKAREKYIKNPSAFTDLTKTYSHLLQ